MEFDQINGESGKHDSQLNGNQPGNKLNHTDAKSEGPILGASGGDPMRMLENVLAGNDEKHAQVLIVDDELVNINLYKRLFRGSPVTFETADSLSSALAAVERMKDCKVLLTDFNLSKIETSIPLIKRTKELFPNAKIIVVSGNEDAEQAITCLGIEAKFFLKPFNVSELKTVVESYLK
jgi:CheY-like chemotaxis protein